MITVLEDNKKTGSLQVDTSKVEYKKGLIESIDDKVGSILNSIDEQRNQKRKARNDFLKRFGKIIIKEVMPDDRDRLHKQEHKRLMQGKGHKGKGAYKGKRGK